MVRNSNTSVPQGHPLAIKNPPTPVFSSLTFSPNAGLVQGSLRFVVRMCPPSTRLAGDIPITAQPVLMEVKLLDHPGSLATSL